MPLQIAVPGIYPRSEQLVEKTRSYERGRVTWEVVQEQIDSDTRQIVQLQQNGNFQTISDGSVSWHDQLRPLTRAFDGITLGTRYSRWFDTNTFFQKPLVTGKIKARNFKVEEFLRSDLYPETKNWKVSIPGPYTFSQLADNQYYPNPLDLMSDLAEAENNLVQNLVTKGVTSIQLAEPSLVYQPYRRVHPQSEELGAAFHAVNRAIKGLEKNFTIQTFFGDASPILDQLLNLNAATIGFDVFETNYSKFNSENSKKLALGIVDSRDSNVESPKWIAETAGRILKHVNATDVVLQPNSDLKFVPKRVAEEKVRSLEKAREEIRWES